MFNWFKKGNNKYTFEHRTECLKCSSLQHCTCPHSLQSSNRNKSSSATRSTTKLTANNHNHVTDDVGSPRTRKVGPPPLKQGVDYINPCEEDQMEVYGYRKNFLKQLLTWLMIITSVGLIRLIFHWRTHWMLVCTHSQCDIKDADKLLLVDGYNQIFVEKVIRLKSVYQSSHKKKEDIECYGSILDSRGDLLKPKSNGVFEPVDELTYFDSKKLRYIWEDELNNFIKVESLDVNTECSTFHRLNGLSNSEQEKRRILYGSNEIKVEVQSIINILFNEVLGPFYVFQVFSIILWGFENYVMYASCIVIMSTLSLVSSVIQIRRNQTQLRDTVQGVDNVQVYKGNGIYEETDSVNLVPGDIISIPGHGCIMTCDAVLISGNVIVNESMLTGESVPVTKTPLPDINYRSEIYDPKEHAKHTLFCGTKAIQTRYYEGGKVQAVVLRTGYSTAKGELVRSIMFPKPVDFRFNRHIYKFIQYLAILAAIGFIYTVVLKAQRGVGVGDILLKALDLITIIIPPALPMAMTIGVIFAQTRLKQSDIYCISPRSINISGCINCVCFDKTGTLTEDDLNFSEVVPVEANSKLFGNPIHDLLRLDKDDDHDAPLIRCLATCHSLTIIENSIIGDPLDQKMFAATNWVLEEPNVDDTEKYDLLAPTVVKPKPFNARCKSPSPIARSLSNSDSSVNRSSEKLLTVSNQQMVNETNGSTSDLTGDEVGILRQFQFSSSLQRMSVVTRKLNSKNFEVYTKGAPEIIVSLCDPRSLPTNFDTILQEYTQKGFRVLALASRPLNTSFVKMQRATREEIESGLNFLGLLIMGNMLKPETTAIIDTLMNANIRTVMVTGDNMLTALSVARECHMIHVKDRVVLLEVDEVNSFSSFDAEDVNYDHDGTENDSGHDKGIPLPPLLTWKFADHVNRKDSVGSLSSVPVYKDQCTLDFNSSNDDKLHVAITGKTFRVLREHYPSLLNKVAIRGTVFSRMAPEQKQQLVELLQDLGYYVGMCGDGANDCGALKAAHAGVSLSETEASVASPFTSKQANISCIPILIREGRTSLVTAFGILKYMACYSICQFVSVILLYTMWSNLTDFQFLYEDLFLISLFFVVFGRTESFENLSKSPPPSSLIGITPLISLALQIVLIIGFQMFAVFFLWKQSWYIPHVPTDELDLACHDNYAVFAVSVFQYITLAVVFSKGSPYRKPIYTNYLFLASLIVMTVFTMYAVLIPPQWAIDLFEFKMDFVDINFRAIMVLLAVINFFLAFFAEAVIVDYLVFIKLKEWLKERTSSQTMYDKIYNATRTTDWLPRPYNNEDHIYFNDGSGDKEMINSCDFQGSVRFNNITSRLNGYTNSGLIVDDHHDISSGDDGNLKHKRVDDIIINTSNRAKSSPSESGICIMSPVSAPVSPTSKSPLSAPTFGNNHIITTDKPVYKSISNIPFDTKTINQVKNEEHHHAKEGKHNEGFSRSNSLVLIDNQETRDEETDLKPILNGNSSDVLI